MWQALKESRLVSYLSLFSSLGTLMCCAIPSTLVLLGLGAGLAGFLAKFPEFIWLSDNKGLVFGTSFLMLGFSYLGQRYSENKACPIEKTKDCEATKSWSRPIFVITLVINMIGSFYAFILPHLM